MIRDQEWTRLLSSRLVLVAVLLVAFAVYAPTLGDWFSGDDLLFLRSSQAIPIGEYTVKSLDFRETGTLPEYNRYRPLYPIAWRLEYEAFGLDALGYRAVLVGLHLGCVVLVWFIALRLTKGVWAANLAALIFAVHPAYASAVAWISGGNRVCAAFPYLLSLVLFMKYLDGGGRRSVYYVGSLLSFVVAILFHSSALTLAAVLPAYAYLVEETPRRALRVESWLRFAPYAVVTVALVGIQVWVRSNLNMEETFKSGWHQYAAYGNYLGRALFPVFPLESAGIAEPLLTALTALEQLGSVAMLALTVGLLVRHPWSRAGVFAVLWFYVALLPDSTIVFVAQGRILYLPGASLALILVLAVMWLKEALPSSLPPWTARAAAVVLIVALVPTAWLVWDHSRGPHSAGEDNQEMVAQLRQAVPSLDAQATLYVVNAPLNLVLSLTDGPLDALVELYYGEVEVRALGWEEAAELEASLDEKDRIFRFER